MIHFVYIAFIFLVLTLKCTGFMVRYWITRVFAYKELHFSQSLFY